MVKLKERNLIKSYVFQPTQNTLIKECKRQVLKISIIHIILHESPYITVKKIS